MRRGVGGTDEVWAVIASVEIIHSGDAEFVHFGLQCGAFQAEACGCASRARQNSSGLPENVDDVFPFFLA
jgi:hypothetical protein